MPRIVAISDTHNFHNDIKVPDGDLLIHAGDATGLGTIREISAFNHWLGTLPHPRKIFVAGNHDMLFERGNSLARSLITNATYLQDEEVTVGGLRVYGSPWTPHFHNWAFNLPRGKVIQKKWDLIPEGLDILITHGPSYGIMDAYEGDKKGCRNLRYSLRRIKPRVHIFGHIHSGYGFETIGETLYINAAICDEEYKPSRPPIVFDLEPK